MAKDIVIGHYPISSNYRFLELPLLYMPDHSPFYVHYSERGTQLGMLRDQFGIVLLQQHDHSEYIASNSKALSNHRSTGAILNYYFPSHAYQEWLGGLFYTSLAFHVGLLLTDDEIIRVDNDEITDYQSFNDKEYIVGLNGSFQLFSHFGVKPFIFASMRPYPTFLYDENLLAKWISSQPLTRYSGKIDYGVSIYAKTVIWPLPLNIIVSVDKQRRWFVGVGLFDYNSYRLNDPKFYMGSQTKMLRPIKETRR